MTPVRFQPLSYLEVNAATGPDRIAVIDGPRMVSYGELRDRVHAAAIELRARGVQSGEVVGVSLANVWEYVALEIAIPLLGAVVMPLPLNLGARERRWALERSGARLVLEQHDAEAVCGATYRGAVKPAAPDPDRVVEIALTSGTTGMPKLAGLDAGLKQATFEAFTARLELTAGDRVLPISPLMQGIGGMCLFSLRLGAALVMLREPRFSADQTLAVAEASRATYLVGVPTNVLRMLEAPALEGVDLSACRVTAVAGAPMPPTLAQAWEARTGSRLVIFYGSMDAGQLAVGSPSDPAAKRWSTVGRIHDCAEAMITAEGEICMRGPTVQKRYWGERHGPLSEDGWAHMGDLGVIDRDGYLRVSGRIKDVIIRGGTNINPYEVEDLIRRHPAVRDVCLVGRPDRELGEVPTAYVVASSDLSVGDLHTHLAGLGVARYKWPAFLELVEEIPLSGPGKVNRKALKERADESALR